MNSTNMGLHIYLYAKYSKAAERVILWDEILNLCLLTFCISTLLRFWDILLIHFRYKQTHIGIQYNMAVESMKNWARELIIWLSRRAAPPTSVNCWRRRRRPKEASAPPPTALDRLRPLLLIPCNTCGKNRKWCVLHILPSLMHNDCRDVGLRATPC